MCGDTPQQAGREDSRRPASEAIRRRYWQPNPRKHIGTILVDVDHQHGIDPLDGPLPTFATLNPASGHQHAAYVLRDAITYGRHTRRAPQQFLEDIRVGLNDALDGDSAYTGLLSRGPYHPDHITRIVSGRVYTLEQLARDLPPLRTHTTTRRELLATAAAAEAEGRNCAAFEALRHVGYRLAREGYTGEGLRRELQHHADKLNNNTWADHPSGPLDPRELRHIVQSITRYIARHHKPNAGKGSPRSRVHSRDRGEALSEGQQLARRRKGQQQGAETRREATREAISAAVQGLRAEGQRVTREALAKRTGITTRTLSKHAELWKE